MLVHFRSVFPSESIFHVFAPLRYIIIYLVELAARIAVLSMAPRLAPLSAHSWIHAAPILVVRFD